VHDQGIRTATQGPGGVHGENAQLGKPSEAGASSDVKVEPDKALWWRTTLNRYILGPCQWAMGRIAGLKEMNITENAILPQRLKIRT